jgi:hypothetical protein
LSSASQLDKGCDEGCDKGLHVPGVWDKPYADTLAPPLAARFIQVALGAKESTMESNEH